MKANHQLPNRISVRFEGYDYSKEGLYFITICTKEKELLFGKITGGIMVLNDIGKIANEYLNEIPNHFPRTRIGEFIVMPNHIHLILMVISSNVPDLQDVNQPVSQFSRPIAGSVSVIIQQYKSSVKRWCNQNNYKQFNWQSRFYDHIIRDDRFLLSITEYIKSNPQKWREDSLNSGHHDLDE